MNETFAVIADIHGNLPALDAVLADIAARGITRIIDLGDRVSGPLWPAETCDRLMALGLPTVRGNHDRWVADLRRIAWAPPTDSPARAGGSAHGLAARVATATGNAGDSRGARQSRATTTAICWNVSRHSIWCPDTPAPSQRDWATHRRWCCAAIASLADRLPDGPTVLNPGSVGCPAYQDPSDDPHVSEAGSPHARYAIVHRSTA